ncbi:MAG TPA: hypothetical protein VNZ86_09325, partial [Bacteroidia bacterium]|nr:hypothetical protein [Bacteroidia bacterium]
MKKTLPTRQIVALCCIACLTFLSSCFYTPPAQGYRPPPPPPPPVYSYQGTPGWAPYYENPASVRYYYIPDMQCYYDVYAQQYIYNDNGMWVHSMYQPPMYSSYNMNNGYVV